MVRAAALAPRPVAIVIRLHLARGWRTGLPRLVLLLQAGNAINFFGYRLIVLGWRAATSIRTALVLDALEQVLWARHREGQGSTSWPIARACAAPQAARCPASPGASVADSVTGLAGDTMSTTLTGSAQHLAGMAPAPDRNGGSVLGDAFPRPHRCAHVVGDRARSCCRAAITRRHRRWRHLLMRAAHLRAGLPQRQARGLQPQRQLP